MIQGLGFRGLVGLGLGFRDRQRLQVYTIGRKVLNTSITVPLHNPYITLIYYSSFHFNFHYPLI